MVGKIEEEKGWEVYVGYPRRVSAPPYSLIRGNHCSIQILGLDYQQLDDLI